MSRVWDKGNDDKLARLVREGLNDRALAERFGVNPTTVGAQRRRLGLAPAVESTHRRVGRGADQGLEVERG